MNITNKQFEALTDLYKILPAGDDFRALPIDHQKIISNFDAVLLELTGKKKRDNARTAAYIAEKRKDNKNYAR